MRLETVRTALELQLRAPSTTHHFLAGRARHPALAAFDAPAEAVRFLNTRGPDGCQQRSAVTAAMIAEAQRRQSDTWATLLMLAYFPGLLGIRATMKPSAGVSADELNALLVESFLETVGALPLASQGRLAVVNLILGTRKTAWQHLIRETARADREELVDDRWDDLLGGFYPSPEGLALAEEAERELQPERIRDWVEALLREETEDDLLLVLGTHATGKPLIDWVRERQPHLDGDALVREYGRLRRRRSRLLERLRDRLDAAPMSQGALRAALLSRDLRAEA